MTPPSRRRDLPSSTTPPNPADRFQALRVINTVQNPTKLQTDHSWYSSSPSTKKIHLVSTASPPPSPQTSLSELNQDAYLLSPPHSRHSFDPCPWRTCRLWRLPSRLCYTCGSLLLCRWLHLRHSLCSSSPCFHHRLQRRSGNLLCDLCCFAVGSDTMKRYSGHKACELEVGLFWKCGNIKLGELDARRLTGDLEDNDYNDSRLDEFSWFGATRTERQVRVQWLSCGNRNMLFSFFWYDDTSLYSGCVVFMFHQESSFWTYFLSIASKSQIASSKSLSLASTNVLLSGMHSTVGWQCTSLELLKV